MSKYKPIGCNFGRPGASGQTEGCQAPGPCRDVCTTPVCGTPQYLTLLAPVVYDEIGINLCRQITLAPNFNTAYPSAVSASAEVISTALPAPSEGEQPAVAPINGRPSCYSVTLQNMTVTFAVKLFDCAGRLLTILTVPAVYLPSPGSPDYVHYDEDTNPSSVELELYAPYGVTYADGNVSAPVINDIGFSTTNSSPAQGLNMITIPKILSFDPDTGDVSMGITVYLKSIYYSQYLIPHNGRAVAPKGSLIPPEDSVCMEFVSGSLLDREIKPLELGPPSYEETLKHDCAGSSSCCSRASSETASPAPAADTASSDTGSGADQAEETTQRPQTASAGAGSAELLGGVSRLGNL